MRYSGRMEKGARRGWPAAKGRGGVHNPANRFERLHVEADPEVAESPPSAEDGGRLATEFLRDTSRSLITHNDSPDIPFSVSLNPYRGCEHGCIYCFARPTHSYLGLSPGLDFESRIYAKVNAGELLDRGLSKAAHLPEPIALGPHTDPSLPSDLEL